ncbi:TPA: serine protein kinase RIO [bacterium]|nr:serine protein kinase RIO [bacterium]
MTKEEWKVYGNVFSEHSRRLLFKMSGQGYFEELESQISVGKEANVFTAITKNNDRIIVKIYRLENCNFNKMYDYLIADPRYLGTARNQRRIVFTWTQREFRNLMLAREVIKVPKPIAFKDNILLMEFIGKTDPAPELKNHPPKDPEKFFKKIVENMHKLYNKGLIHGDLSPFNILNHNEEPVFIDFSQGTMITAADASILLKRDIHNISTYFKRLGVKVDEDSIYEKITK